MAVEQRTTWTPPADLEGFTELRRGRTEGERAVLEEGAWLCEPGRTSCPCGDPSWTARVFVQRGDWGGIAAIRGFLLCRCGASLEW